MQNPLFGQDEKHMAARRALAEVVADIHRTKKTGLLSIVVKSTGNHFKMFFQEGEVYHVTCADSRDLDCLATVDRLEFSECFFVPGVKLDVRGENIPPTAAIIKHLETAAKTVESRSPPGVNIQPPVITDVEEEFIELIGPIGKMIVDNIFSEISYSRGNPMPSDDYSCLLESLIKELPAKQQDVFRAKYKR